MLLRKASYRECRVYYSSIKILVVFCCLTLINGCGFKGQNGLKTKPFTWQNAKRAFMSASSDYGTIVPLVGGVVLASSSYDERLSERARQDNPVFDTPEDAADRTDELRNLTYVNMLGSTLLIPGENYQTKGNRVLVGATALLAARSVAWFSKENINRTSPSERGDNSLISLHSVSPFAAAAITRRNLSMIDIPDWGKYTINTVNYLAATGSAWGRVEMGLHFPSDQLISAAVGNFVSLFVHDFFLESSMNLHLSLNEDMMYLEYRVHY